MNKLLINSLFLALLFPASVNCQTAANDSTQQNGLPVIEFIGNKVFSSAQLHETIDKCFTEYKQSLTKDFNGVFDACITILRNSLREQGYLKVKIDSLKKEESTNATKIVLRVEEGHLYRVGRIEITGAKVFSSEQLLSMFRLKTGDAAAGDAISEWLFERLKAAYADKGYIEYEADPEPIFRIGENGEGIVDLKIIIDEGQAFTVEKIKFEGGDPQTYDLLKSALVIPEGDLYNQSLFEQSIKNLNKLGLYQSIDLDGDMERKADNEAARITIKIKLKNKQ